MASRRLNLILALDEGNLSVKVCIIHLFLSVYIQKNPKYTRSGFKTTSKYQKFSYSLKVYSMPGRSENDTIIAKKKAQRLKAPFVDPLRAAIEPSALSLLAPEMAIRRQALPIRVVDNFLLVAMMTPEEPVAIKSLELLTGFKVRPAVAPKNSLFIAPKENHQDHQKRHKRAMHYLCDLKQRGCR
jgi:hypothetical protein